MSSREAPKDGKADAAIDVDSNSDKMSDDKGSDGYMSEEYDGDGDGDGDGEHECQDMGCDCSLDSEERGNRIEARHRRLTNIFTGAAMDYDSEEEDDGDDDADGQIVRGFQRAGQRMKAQHAMMAPREDWVDVDPATVPDMLKTKAGVPIANILRRPLTSSDMNAARQREMYKKLAEDHYLVYDREGEMIGPIAKNYTVADILDVIGDHPLGDFDISSCVQPFGDDKLYFQG